jgi:glycosyltransferase involved in cell wall biosynthesis
MTFAIITHVDHIVKNDEYFAYGPYVREMNIWGKYVDRMVIVAPKSVSKVSTIHNPYTNRNITFIKIPSISLTSTFNTLRAIVLTPKIVYNIFKAMKKADHIHLRCPGNIGLLGCLVQVLFPKKPKTAKYAGNWDPKAKQPRSYRLQKWILSNTFLSRNMKVLVYGKWPDQTRNILPFFTASYTNEKIVAIRKNHFKPPYKFLFVGSLSPGKRPLYAVQLVEQMNLNGISCRLDIYGEGNERGNLEEYNNSKQLERLVKLHGNQDSEIIENVYKESDFLILPSRSEGWPKVVAEAMFWGVIPVVTRISCIPWMIGNGERGIELSLNLEQDAKLFMSQLKNKERLTTMSVNAQEWSHQYTLNAFEMEIKKMLI